MSTETPTEIQLLARRPYTTGKGTPERNTEVRARLAQIQAVKDRVMDAWLPVTGSTITSHDFCQYVDDRYKDEWTAGRLRHVITALDGRRCIIVADRMTGHTMIGARLRGLRRNPLGGGYQYLAEWDYAPGKHQSTWFRLEALGPAITSMDFDVKYKALQLHRDEQTAAIQAARAALPECTYGAWSAAADYGMVRVGFTPQRADGGPESLIYMEFTAGGYRPGTRYDFTGCARLDRGK